MINILIASHGKLASGFKSSLSILLGQCENITVIDAYLDESNVADTIEQYVSSIPADEQIIMMSDLYGGSVNTCMTPYTQRDNVTLVSGVNLAFVLELAAKSMGADYISKEEINEVIEAARATMQIVEIKLDEKEEEDSFF